MHGHGRLTPVELRAEHLFSAPPQKVARAMVDPEFASGWDQILDVAALHLDNLVLVA